MAKQKFQSLGDLKKLAEKKTEKVLFDYYSTGAGDEQTLQDSIAAFKRFRLIPRIFHALPNPDLGVSAQGHPLRVPFGIAPTALQATAHPEGELATARAAEGFGALMILSSMSQTTIEDVRRAAPDAILWIHTYFFKDRRNTADIVRRAEGQGFKAIVIAADSPVTGIAKRNGKQYGYFREGGPADLDNPLVQTKSLVNLRGCPSDLEKARAAGDFTLIEYAGAQTGQSYGRWSDLEWLKSFTKLPIILKGIISAESAREAVAAGVQGIIVSAHGGRQLDGVQAPIEALPQVVDVVQGSKVEVYMDGGVRSGRDVFKALALGAKAVFLGRPIMWGLLYDGQNGVKEVLQQVEKELVNTMSLCGCNQMSDVTRSRVLHESRITNKL